MTAGARETVLVAAGLTDEGLVQGIADACDRAGLHMVVWRPGARLDGVRGRLALAAAALPPGERRVPEDLVALSTRVCPGLPLLLLSSEALLRPTMTLQNGRITLLGPPLTTARICSRLRILASDGRSGFGSLDTSPGLNEPRSPLVVRRYRQRSFWIGTLGLHDGQPLLPVVAERPADGALALVPRAGRTVDPAEARAAAALVRQAPSDEILALELADVLRDDVGMIHLPPDTSEWTLYWPDASWPLHIFSPLRLPPAFALNKVGSALVRMRAASGDVVAGLTCAPADYENAEALAVKAVAEGGPALHELLADALRQRPDRVAGAVVEVA
jgi:hypothetical protein